MKRDKRKRSFIWRGLAVMILIVTSVSFVSCTAPYRPFYDASNDSQGTEEKPDIGFVPAGVGSFDSADTAVLMTKNEDDGSITLWNRSVGKSYTLTYDGTTHFYDKYGEGLSLDQISPGDIVEVTFLKSKKHLTALKMSPQIWNLEQVTSFNIDTVRGEATVGQDAKKLKITENTKYFSNGRSIDATELNPVDVVSFQGIDSEVLVVKLERGHGYLRLSGDKNFIGGWIEIGQSNIRRITEDMLLPVAEGSYSVLVSKEGNTGEKSAVIHRNEETVLDISDLEVAEPEEGLVLFHLDPSNASLYVDGEPADSSLPVKMLYGIHQLIARASGYQTLTLYVKVGQPTAELDITLEPVKSSQQGSSGTKTSGSTQESTSGSTQESESSQQGSEDGYYKVYIEAPEGVDVYLDGNYVGVAPCSFRKEAGSHMLILSKKGYVPKTYTLQIQDDQKDISYSFAELQPVGMIATENK